MNPLLLRTARAIRAIRDDVVAPPYSRPGHYLSPRTGQADIRRAKARRAPIGVELNEERQLALVETLDLSPPREARYSSGPSNVMFSVGDASFYRGMLLAHRPGRIVEVGSGYSTALALDVAESDLPDLEITCVEPDAARLRSRLRPGDEERLTLVEGIVQDVDPATIAGMLSDGDVLFIDSSHVCKAGSDVGHLLLHLLPRLARGVHVHIHDIHWPFEYDDEWLDERRDWNEAYLLHAFLIGNQEWTMQLFADWLRQVHPDRLPAHITDAGTGSVWLRRV